MILFCWDGWLEEGGGVLGWENEESGFWREVNFFCGRWCINV